MNQGCPPRRPAPFNPADQAFIDEGIQGLLGD